MENDQGWCPDCDVCRYGYRRCPCCIPLRERPSLVNVLCIGGALSTLIYLGAGLHLPVSEAAFIVIQMLNDLNKNKNASSAPVRLELNTLLNELETNVGFAELGMPLVGACILVSFIVCPLACCLDKKRSLKCFGILFLWIIVHGITTLALIYIWIHTIIILQARKDIKSKAILNNTILWTTLAPRTRGYRTGDVPRGQGASFQMGINLLFLLYSILPFVYGLYVYIKVSYYVVQERKNGNADVLPPAIEQDPMVQPNPTQPMMNPYEPNPYAQNAYTPNPNAPYSYLPPNPNQ